MRRERYRKILIILAVVITLIGIWCLFNLDPTDPVMKGTFVYVH